MMEFRDQMLHRPIETEVVIGYSNWKRILHYQCSAQVLFSGVLGVISRQMPQPELASLTCIVSTSPDAHVKSVGAFYCLWYLQVDKPYTVSPIMAKFKYGMILSWRWLTA